MDKLRDLCGRVLEALTEHECHSYSRHCGYRYSQDETAQTVPMDLCWDKVKGW